MYKSTVVYPVLFKSYMYMLIHRIHKAWSEHAWSRGVLGQDKRIFFYSVLKRLDSMLANWMYRTCIIVYTVILEITCA